MKKINKYLEVNFLFVILQIVLMIGMTFSICYFISESDKPNKIESNYNPEVNKTRIALKVLSLFNKIFFSEKTLVSATDSILTCPQTKNGSICQEFVASECADKCAQTCIPTRLNQTSVCQQGTCYSSSTGSCTTGATKGLCEYGGGNWSNDPFGNTPECKKGCCILGDKAVFENKKTCEIDSQRYGINNFSLSINFRPEIDTEWSCLALSKTQDYGACIIQNEVVKTCKFTTELECKSSLRGEFKKNVLCSNPTLGTNCIKQAKVDCTDQIEKEEVYWYDSCGNRENIFEGVSQDKKDHSYNNGLVLQKSDACSLIDGNNFLANQKTCGNCNRILGSACGIKTGTEFLTGINSNVVCKDLSCIDKDGEKRANGESWCEYQGSVGTDNGSSGLLRSTDTVGSRDFKKQCVDGKIITEPCGDYRNFLCTETRTPGVDGEFSTAACRVNRWRECINFNDQEKLPNCESNPDCFIKEINVPDSQFKFKVCVPRYSPGFNLDQTGNSAKDWCGQATQTCKYVKTCSAFGSCTEVNAGCLEAGFAEQMNDLCMSFGDCGTKANYIGDVTVNHKLTENGNVVGGQFGRLNSAYINKLVNYANERLFKNKYITTNLTQYYGNLTIPGLIEEGTPEAQAFMSMGSMVTGAIGIAFFAVGHLAPSALGGFFAAGAGVHNVAGTAFVNTGQSVFTGAAGNTLASVGTAVMSAAALAGIAFTIYGFAEQGDWAAVALLSVVAVVATLAIATSGFTTALTLAAVLSALPIVGLIIAAIAIILSFLGSTTKIDVKFECKPWQAPLGGAKCGQCGKDGFVCSNYACKSLGQTCQLINENTLSPTCVDIDPGDVTPPVISGDKSLLPDGYIGEDNENGMILKSSSADGCISETYQLLPFGINLNEPGRCKLDTNHTTTYDNMGGIDLTGGLFLNNHSVPIVIPSLDSLGYDGFDPRARANVNLYFRCQDKVGNSNSREYIVNFCIKQGNDTSPAAIIARNPKYEKVPFDTTNISAAIYTKEPADCKWDINQNKTYEQMTNNMTCITGLDNKDVYNNGWKCNTSFEFPLDKNETTYYIKCLDQPWLSGENYSKRNPNTQSYPFKIVRATPLQIENVNVDNKTFSFSQEPGSLEVNFTTSGGYDGTAHCSFVYENYSVPLFITDDLIHKQSFQVFRGLMSRHIVCEDRIGSKVEKDIKAIIKIDAEAPIITRTYIQSGTLIISTDEPSSCFYSNDNVNACWFDLENGTAMTGFNMVSHTTQFDNSKTYYIKCKDNFGHYTGECNLIVRDGKYET